MVNKIKKKFSSNGLKVFGLSTAFEDFSFNNRKNTENLLHKRALVGETKKAFSDRNISSFDEQIDFPVALDKLTSGQELSKEEHTNFICNLNPRFKFLSPNDQDEMKKKIREYLITLQKTSMTFTLNQFKGTPTFVLFDQNKIVLHEWFGHKSMEETERLILAGFEQTNLKL
ncbi:MAG: hypothetical protein ACE5FU_00620 [Nitrospinota bacterium]